ncbi:hypothetical protein AB0J83_46860 [Actinoplanes sp. NPDC049596]|uniref:phasin family protein n=1 Tax=unclassified Actinoplanes TaxID=2626549 RepID=UPI0034144B46
MPDAWRAYLDLALGLTEAPRKRAQKVAGELVNKGGATAAQLQGLVDDLLSAGVANREALTNIVRYEVERALNVVGLATAEEVTELQKRLKDLEDQLRDAEARASVSSEDEYETGGTRIERPAPLPRKKAAKKAVPNAMPSAGTTPAAAPANTSRLAKKAVAKKVAAAETATAGAAPIPPAKKAVAKKAVAKKVAADDTATAGATPVGPAKRAAIGESRPGTPGQNVAETEATPSAAIKKVAKAAKKAPAKKAAKKATPAAPAGTAEAPTAAVRDAAAGTVLPPLSAPETPAPIENKPGSEA